MIRFSPPRLEPGLGPVTQRAGRVWNKLSIPRRVGRFVHVPREEVGSVLRKVAERWTAYLLGR